MTLFLLVAVSSLLTLTPSSAQPVSELDDEPVSLTDEELGQLFLDGEGFDEEDGVEDGDIHQMGKRSPSTFSRILRSPSTFSRILRGESSFSRLVILAILIFLSYLVPF